MINQKKYTSNYGAQKCQDNGEETKMKYLLLIKKNKVLEYKLNAKWIYFSMKIKSNYNK